MASFNCRALLLAAACLASTIMPAVPQATLESFAVTQMRDTAELRLTFSSPVSIADEDPCFMNKVIFVDTNQPSRRLQPLYSGTCNSASMSLTVTASLDIRDFISMVGTGLLTARASSSMITSQAPVYNFLRGVNLNISTPLSPATFLAYSGINTRLDSFDIDLDARKLILHYSDIILVSSFTTANTFTLSVPNTALTHTLTPSSRPEGISVSTVKSLCVTLSPADVLDLRSRSICTTYERCQASFTSSLGINYIGGSVIPTTPMTTLPVRNIYPSRASLAPGTRFYMELQLSYASDCDATRLLAPDEVYYIRSGEYLTRITCYATTDMWPNLTFGEAGAARVPQGVSRAQNYTSLSVSGGFGTNMLGLYTCGTEGIMIRHYIVPEAQSFIGLPNGMSYSARLYDSISIPFYFLSIPRIDFTDMATSEIVLDQLTGTSETEASFRRLSQFRGEIMFNIAPFSLNAEFRLTVRSNSITNPTRVLTISITDPEIYTIPRVVGILPSDTEFTLQCNARNPLLQEQVFWVPGLASAAMTSGNSFDDLVSRGRSDYTCIVRDPENNQRIAAQLPVYVRSIPEPISVFNDGRFVQNLAEFQVSNQFTPNLILQCIGHAPSNVYDLVWVSQKTGEPPMLLLPEMNNGQIQVTYNYNEANITIVNSVEPYRGILRCQSSRSGRQAAFYLVENRVGNTTAGCPREVDSVWGITWEVTRISATRSQPCPQVNGSYTGFAYRECGSDGKWESSVNATGCSSAVFSSLFDETDAFVNGLNSMTPENQIAAYETLSSRVLDVVAPRNFSYFPQELSLSLNIIERLTAALTTMYNNQQYSSLDLLMVFDNLLNPINRVGWMGVSETNPNSGGLALLNSIQNVFTSYILLVRTDDKNFVRGENLYLSVVRSLDEMSVIFPNNSDSRAREAQITVPTSEIRAVGATGVINYAIRNIGNFLYRPNPENNSQIVSEAASPVLIALLYPNRTALEAINSEYIRLNFTTSRMLRARNPRCAFWNMTSGSWDDSGVNTTSIRAVEVEEYKSYEVECSSYRTRAQVVLVDIPSPIQAYEVTTAAYVGGGFILFFAVMTMFLFVTSCVCGRDLSYYLSMYLVRMSFFSAIIVTFVVFLVATYLGPADMNQTITHTEGTCTFVSVLLHYFFTASFTWLLCEAMVLTAFKTVSTHAWSFIIFFIIGWGLPVIPVVVSVGVLRDLYTSESFCWFYFDGEITSRIFLSFLVPKLFLVASILVLLPMGLITACRMRLQKMDGESNLPIFYVMYSWLGLLVEVLFLSAVWVFLVFHVNNYEINNSGWVFAGVAIAFGIWIMANSFISVMINQKIDYELFWAVFDGKRTLKRTKKEKKPDEIPLEDNMFEPSKNEPEYEVIPPKIEKQDSFDDVGDEEEGKTYID